MNEVNEKKASLDLRLQLNELTEPMPGNSSSRTTAPDAKLRSCSTECTSRR